MPRALKIIALVEWPHGTRTLTPILELDPETSTDHAYSLATAISPTFIDTENNRSGFEFETDLLVRANVNGSQVNGIHLDRNLAASVAEARRCVLSFQAAGGKVSIFAMAV